MVVFLVKHGADPLSLDIEGTGVQCIKILVNYGYVTTASLSGGWVLETS